MYFNADYYKGVITQQMSFCCVPNTVLGLGASIKLVPNIIHQHMTYCPSLLEVKIKKRV